VFAFAIQDNVLTHDKQLQLEKFADAKKNAVRALSCLRRIQGTVLTHEKRLGAELKPQVTVLDDIKRLFGVNEDELFPTIRDGLDEFARLNDNLTEATIENMVNKALIPAE
jgi:hypothetical protein